MLLRPDVAERTAESNFTVIAPLPTKPDPVMENVDPGVPELGDTAIEVAETVKLADAVLNGGVEPSDTEIVCEPVRRVGTVKYPTTVPAEVKVEVDETVTPSMANATEAPLFL